MRVWIAIWTGSSHISTAIARWIAGGVALRLLLVVLAAGFIKGLPWTTSIAVLAAAAWIVTAVILGLRLPDPTAPATPEPKPTQDADGPSQEAAPTTGAIPREQLVTALHQVGAPHAHITALAEHLDTTTDAVREALTAAGIPTSGGVRMKGRRVAVSPGVKESDFPPLLSPGENTATVGPLTSNNNDNNNGADPFETVPDEANPARTHVRWAKR